MKNTFAVSMTLLLALTLVGSVAGYRLATTSHEGGAEAPAAAESPVTEATGSAAPGEAPKAEGATGEAPSETAAAAAGGAAGGTMASGSTAESGSGDAKAGAPLFASNCAGCHGANAKGGVGPNLLLADGPKAWTDPQFLTALREGKTPERALNAIMPRFTDAQLKDGDVANIHAYLKSLN